MLRCAMRVRTRISVSVSCGLRPQAAHPIRPCREISSEGTSCEEAGGIENSKAGAVRVYVGHLEYVIPMCLPPPKKPDGLTLSKPRKFFV